MQEQVNNTFDGGLNTDMPVYQTPNTVYTDADNITFLTHNGNEIILQNEKGNVFKTMLKNNYIPIGNRSINGVCYIISAETDNFGRFTGRGEIGSFPSPDYSNVLPINCALGSCDYTGNLTQDYRPFVNYAGDNNTPLNQTSWNVGYGEFNSINFNFKSTNPFELELQEVYDGTINVIFTDWDNKPKIINSRFTVRPDNKVLIVNRQGFKDTNLYNELSFDNALNVVLTSNKLVNVQYLGQSSDGKLSCGNYKYFFKYITQDGNTSDFIGGSFTCSVFFGNSVQSTRGGVTNEPTSKANILKLSNLDTSFSAVKVYFSYSSGLSSSNPLTTIFEIEQSYQLTSDSIQIIHTGFENTQVTDSTELSIDGANIYTWRTMTQREGRLFCGNIKGFEYDYKILREFAEKIKIGQSEKTLSSSYNLLKDFNDNSFATPSEIYLPIPYNSSRLSGFEGLYYNPRNIHDKLGYWAGETYMFGVAFFFKNGNRSPVFPLRGVDNLEGLASYSGLDFNTPATEPLNSFEETTGENVRGVYRFTKRAKVSPLIKINEDAINILCAQFFIPKPDSTILKDIIGLQFFRTSRKKDIVSQGLLFDTIALPLQDFDGQSVDSYNSWFNSVYNFKNEIKFIPAFDFRHESLSRNGQLLRDGGSNVDKMSNEIPQVPNKIGIEPIRMNRFTLQSLKTASNYGKNFAYYTGELNTNAIQTSGTLNNSIEATPYCFEAVGQAVHQFEIPTRRTLAPYNNFLPTTSGDNTNFSLIKHVYTSNTNSVNLPNFVGASGFPLGFHKATFDFVLGNQATISANKFTSRIEALSMQGNSYFDYTKGIYASEGNGNFPTNSKKHYITIKSSFEDYFGVTVKNSMSFGNTSSSGISPDLVFEFKDNPTTNECGKYIVASSIINTFNNDTESYRTTFVNKQLYFPENESYFPISQPIYWDRVIANEQAASSEALCLNEVAEDNSTQFVLDCYNGDNFITHNFKRVFFNNMDRLVTNSDQPTEERKNINVGHVVSFMTENNSNPAFRNEEIIDINEYTNRSFLPFYGKDLTIGNQKGINNNWREYRLLETKAYSTGYSYIGGADKLYVALNKNNPFVQTMFDTRIAYSEKYTTSKFENAYRYFTPVSKQDYSKHLSQITSIKSLNNGLICVQENGVSLIPVSERIGGVQDSAGKVFFESSGVLAPVENVNYISEMYGTKWQHSVLLTDNTVYGVDINRAKIWAVNGNSLQLISDFNVQKKLREIAVLYQNSSEEWLKCQVRTYYDFLKSNVIFTFIKTSDNCGTTQEIIQPSCPITSLQNGVINISGGNPKIINDVPLLCYGDKMLSLTYNERPVTKWLTKNTWFPVNMFTIFDKTYSFPVEKDRNKIYQHYVNDLFTTYYDEQHLFTIEFVANNGSQFHKIYDNLFLISNHIYPKQIEYTTDDGTFLQTIKPKTIVANAAGQFKVNPINSIMNYDALYKEDGMYITIIKDESDTRKAFDYINRRVRDKYCKIKITYETSDPLIIQAIMTKISKSYA